MDRLILNDGLEVIGHVSRYNVTNDRMYGTIADITMYIDSSYRKNPKIKKEPKPKPKVMESYTFNGYMYLSWFVNDCVSNNVVAGLVFISRKSNKEVIPYIFIRRDLYMFSPETNETINTYIMNLIKDYGTSKQLKNGVYEFYSIEKEEIYYWMNAVKVIKKEYTSFLENKRKQIRKEGCQRKFNTDHQIVKVFTV